MDSELQGLKLDVLMNIFSSNKQVSVYVFFRFRYLLGNGDFKRILLALVSATPANWAKY